jgi:hypothetical protein
VKREAEEDWGRRTHFSFCIDTWTPDGESIAACERWPNTPITLRQSARVIEDSRHLRLA